MVTDCFGAKAFDFSDAEAVFLQGSFSLLKVMIPGAICFLLWRFYVMNKGAAQPNVSILGLNTNAMPSQNTQVYFSKFSPLILLLYVTTTAVTFNIGLLSVLAFESLHNLLHEVP